VSAAPSPRESLHTSFAEKPSLEPGQCPFDGKGRDDVAAHDRRRDP
jgi:hypothetical protein